MKRRTETNTKKKAKGHLSFRLRRLSVREGVELPSGVLSLGVVPERDPACCGVDRGVWVGV